MLNNQRFPILSAAPDALQGSQHRALYAFTGRNESFRFPEFDRATITAPTPRDQTENSPRIVDIRQRTRCGPSNKYILPEKRSRDASARNPRCRWEHAMASTTVNSSDVRGNSAGDALTKNWWLFTLRGALGIIFGCIALIFPGPTMLSLVIVFSAYMLVDGVAGIISAVRAIRRGGRWGLLVFEGLVNIAVGIIAFLWPGITVVAFVLLVAAWAIVSGALMTTAGFRLNIDHGRWWLVLGGLLSLAYGALLVVTPLIGAIVLTWWLGAYALAFGVALVIFSFKLRSRQLERGSPNAVGTAA
jgi:uncharacterized membrane protein HdeD (DUF308 family)